MSCYWPQIIQDFPFDQGNEKCFEKYFFSINKEEYYKITVTMKIVGIFTRRLNVLALNVEKCSGKESNGTFDMSRQAWCLLVGIRTETFFKLRSLLNYFSKLLQNIKMTAHYKHPFIY